MSVEAVLHSHYAHMATELIVGFFALFFVMKIIGKREIKQLTPFDFISSIVLSELLGNALYAPETKLTHILFALGVWTILLLAVEKLGLRYRTVGNYFDGKPSIIIRQGMIDHEEMRNNKLTIHELQSLLRQGGHFSVRDIEYAIFEANGSVSVLPKDHGKPVYLPYTLIADGEVLWENLQEAGLDQTWLEEQLKQAGYQRMDEVFLAEWLPDQGLHLVPKRLQNQASSHTPPLL